MAATEPDASTQAIAADAETDFRRVRRGFEPEQVRAVLAGLTGRIGQLEAKADGTQRLLEDARRELDAARSETRPAPHETVTAQVNELVRRFEQDTEELRRRAELEATGVLAEARTEATRIRTQVEREERQAHAQAEELLQAARAEADRLRSQLDPVREATMGKIRELRDRLAGSVRELDRVLGGAEDQLVVLGEAEGDGSTTHAAPAEPQRSRSDVVDREAPEL